MGGMFVCGRVEKEEGINMQTRGGERERGA